MKQKYIVPIICTSFLTILSLFSLLKVIDSKELWKIICASIALIGFFLLLALVLSQMIKENKKKNM